MRKLPLRPSSVVLAIAMTTTPPPNANTLAGRVSHLSAQEPRQGTAAWQEPVTLRVAVRDKDEQLVKDLTREEFRIFEDGKEQQIGLFSRGDPRPLTLGFLMQWSGQRRETLPYGEIDPASQFFRSLMDKNDVAFVARFSDTIEPLTDLASNPMEIERSLRRATEAKLQGASALYDAISWACREKLLPRLGQRVIVVVADGHDNRSKKQLSAAIESALRAETAIYVVSLAYADPFLKGHTLREAINSAEELAKKTGGEAVFVRSQKDWAAAFNVIHRELRSRYTLGYYPTNIARDGKFHRIKVKTTRKGLHVLTREGYYAPKD